LSYRSASSSKRRSLGLAPDRLAELFLQLSRVGRQLRRAAGAVSRLLRLSLDSSHPHPGLAHSRRGLVHALQGRGQARTGLALRTLDRRGRFP
jgi:hypothetical protein